MKIKAFILTGILAFSMLCACGSNNENTNNGAANTEAISTETANDSGNFSEVVIIENPSTDTVIVEMP